MGELAVSVVIPVCNMATTIGDQLAALERQDFTGQWEIVVADNGSTDATAAVVRDWDGRVPTRLVDASASRGSGYARNCGAAAAGGDLLAFCDADDEVRPDWLRVIVGALEISPVVAGVYDNARFNAPELAAAYDDGSHPGPAYGFLKAGPGGSCGIRRDAFEQIGGFDVGLLRSQDIDFCWRAQLAGHELIVEPAAIVDRRLRATTLRRIFARQLRSGTDTVLLYTRYRAHGMPRSSAHEVAYDYARIVKRFAVGRRASAARLAGWRAGRLIGSVRFRVLCP